MKSSELATRAIEIIKKPEVNGDWIIAPTQHAGLYRESAPALASILSSSAIKMTAEQYEEYDRDAMTSQNSFKKKAFIANLAVFLTACLGALLLAFNSLSAVFDFSTSRTAILVTMSVAAVLVGGVGTMLLFQIQSGKLLEVWMTRRARAESYRLKLFNLITSVQGVDDAAADIPLPLLQLEYFCRYQLDVQVAYYKNASKRHAAAASKILSWSGIAVFLGTVATGSAGILGVDLRQL